MRYTGIRSTLVRNILSGKADPAEVKAAMSYFSLILLVIAAIIGLVLYIHYRKTQESNEMAEEVMEKCMEEERRKSGF